MGVFRYGTGIDATDLVRPMIDFHLGVSTVPDHKGKQVDTDFIVTQ